MARKSRSSRSSRRSSSRKIKHTRKHKRTHKRRTHRRGGAALNGAPVGYHLSGDWSSKMSLGQGADYFKYHEGQHGGAALAMSPFPGAVESSGLPAALRGPAHIGGIDKAIADVRGLSDAPNSTATVGGRRRRHSKRHGSKKHSRRHSKRHSKKHRKTHHRRRGGALGYAPFPSSSMLLNSQAAYAQAGLNPEWKTDIAFTDAKIRETQ